MLGIIEYVFRIRDKLEKYGEWLENFNKNVFNGFNAVYNALTLTLELLNYYYNVWTSYDVSRLSPDEIDRLRKENAERVIEITRWAFVHTMSIIEFSIKNSLEFINPSILRSIRTRKSKGRKHKRVHIHLRDIIKELKRRRCIGDDVYNNWLVLIEIRNLVVHNNTIADSDKVLYIGGMNIQLVKNQMLKGELNFFVKLIDHAIESYKQTMEKLPNCRST